MKVTVKKMVDEQVEINSIVRNKMGEVVGLFAFASDAEEFMKRCGYNEGTMLWVRDND